MGMIFVRVQPKTFEDLMQKKFVAFIAHFVARLPTKVVTWPMSTRMDDACLRKAFRSNQKSLSSGLLTQ
jgi:hypothetical protein